VTRGVRLTFCGRLGRESLAPELLGRTDVRLGSWLIFCNCSALMFTTLMDSFDVSVAGVEGKRGALTPDGLGNKLSEGMIPLAALEGSKGAACGRNVLGRIRRPSPT
jgi:hypothetical protein